MVHGLEAVVLEVVSPSAIHPLTRPESIKRVREAATLGRGAFGTVYRATCCTNGDVAVKVMPDGAPSHELSRLAFEAKVLTTGATLYYDDWGAGGNSGNKLAHRHAFAKHNVSSAEVPRTRTRAGVGSRVFTVA